MTNFNFLLNNLSYLSNEDLVVRQMDSTCFRSAPVPPSFRLRLHPLRMVATLLLLLFLGVGEVWGAQEYIIPKLYLTAKDSPSGNTGWVFTNTTCNNAKTDYWKMVNNTSVATSPAFDISGYTNVTVSIKWGSYGEFNSTYCNATVKISTSSGNWATLGKTGLTSASTGGTVYSFDNVEESSSYSSAQIQISTPSATGSVGGRIYYVEIKGEKAAATPSITPDPTSLDWGTVLQSSSQDNKTISITGSNLTAGTLTIDATGGYSVTPTSKSVSGTLAATTLTVTPPSTSTTGAKNGKVTISGGGLASNVEVNLSMTVNAASTVTWMNNGSEYTTTLVANGSKPEFPINPSSCDGTSTTFVGWTPTPWSGKLDDVGDKTIYTSGSAMPDVSGPVTYHAVFAKCVYSKISDYTSLSSGDKIVIRDNKNSNIFNNDFTATYDNVSTTTITPLAKQIWTITGNNTDGWTFKSGSATLGFTTAPTSGSKTQSVSNTSTNSSSWKLANFTGTYAGCISIKKGTAVFEYSSGWKVYYNAGDQYAAMQIFKATYSKYLTSCCTPLGSINGSVYQSN